MSAGSGLWRPEVLREVAKLGPTAVLAVLVWYELHELRTRTMEPMARDVAVLVDRCEVQAQR